MKVRDKMKSHKDDASGCHWLLTLSLIFSLSYFPYHTRLASGMISVGDTVLGQKGELIFSRMLAACEKLKTEQCASFLTAAVPITNFFICATAVGDDRFKSARKDNSVALYNHCENEII